MSQRANEARLTAGVRFGAVVGSRKTAGQRVGPTAGMQSRVMAYIWLAGRWPASAISFFDVLGYVCDRECHRRLDVQSILQLGR